MNLVDADAFIAKPVFIFFGSITDQTILSLSEYIRKKRGGYSVPCASKYFSFIGMTMCTKETIISYLPIENDFPRIS